MSAIQTGALVVVAISGTAVALTRDPLRQALVLGINGLALTAMLFAFQAPDVALSEIVISGVGLPVIVFAALRKLARQDFAAKHERRE